MGSTIDQPVLSEYQQFYIVYGECFSIWSSVESRLLAIYQFSLGTPDLKCASSAFYSTTGFRAKLEMVDAVVTSSEKITPVDIEKWRKLCSDISKKSANRNKLAHNKIFFGRESDIGKKKLFIGSPDKPFENARFYYHDLTLIKNSFVQIEEQLMLFWVGLIRNT